MGSKKKVYRKDGKRHCHGCGNGFDIALIIEGLCTKCLKETTETMKDMRRYNVSRGMTLVGGRIR